MLVIEKEDFDMENMFARVVAQEETATVLEAKGKAFHSVQALGLYCSDV